MPTMSTDQDRAEAVERILAGQVQCQCGVWGDAGEMFKEKGTWRHYYPCDRCVQFNHSDDHSLKCLHEGRHK